MAIPLRLLILEDNPSDAELMLHSLRRAGYDPSATRVETEEDFRDHLERVPEIVLADYSMPKFDSLRALEILQERHLDIPFIIVSGTIGEERAVQVMQQGATDYIMKDRLERLGQAVAKGIERSLTRKTLREHAVLAAFQADIVLAFTRNTNLRDMLQYCVASMVKNLDAAFARIWTLNAADQVLELQASAGLYTHLDGPHGRVPVGKYKIGLIAEERKAHLTNDVANDPRIGDAEWAKREGMVAFAGYPLMLEDRLLGVMGMFARNRLTDTTLRAMASMANKIALGIERKSAEGSLRDTEERTRLLLNSVAEPIYGIDMKGMCTFTNTACLHALGYTDAEWLIGKNMHALIHHTRADGTPYPVEECLIYRAFREGQGAHVDNEVLWRADGTSFPAEYWSNPIRYDGQIVGSVVSFLDITQRRNLEAQFRQSEQRLQHVVASSPAVLFTLVRDGEYLRPTWISDNVREMMGYEADEALQPGWWFERVHPDEIEFIWSELVRVLYSTDRHTDEYRFRHKNGAYRWVRSEMRLLRDAAGEQVEVVGSWSDITDSKRTESERDAVLSRLQLHIERMPLAYMLFDSNFRITDWNPAAERLFGYAKAEALGLRPANLVAPEFQPEAERLLSLIRAGDMTAHSTNENLTKDGRTITCEWYNTPLMAEDGSFSGVLCLAGDVSERTQAANSLKFSEARYRRLFEAAQDGILIVDPASRQVFDVNPFLAKLLGYSREEFMGRELWEIGLYQDAESNKAAFDTLLVKGYVRYDDLPLVTKDGRKIDVEFVSNLYDVGATQVIQCNIRDITERMRIEETLRLRDRAIQAINLGILITDQNKLDNPIIYASPGFERVTGYGSGEILGRNCRFLQGKDTDPARVTQVREAIRAGEPCTVEVLNYRKNGTAFWNELSLAPVIDPNGKVTHFVGVQTDVTQRRQLENQFRQAQKMEAIGQLAGGVAHDFNNLLTIISGYSELLLEMLTDDDPKTDAVKAIAEAGERAAGLTRQLLAFSRQSVLETKILDLNDVVKETEKLLRRMIGEDIVLTTVLDPNLSRIKVDPGQIGQVLMNLAVNARDAMPKGGNLTIETSNVQLEDAYAELHTDGKPGPYVKLVVTDSGSGMTPEVKAHIFEPFFTTKGPGKGSGLGLATVYGIVKQFGGIINLYSEPDLGTSFKIYLPAIAESPKSSAESGARKVKGGTETILLVEDDDGVRAIALLGLQTQGYTVLQANCGKKALEIIEKHPERIDLFVTDVVMPGMSGRELAETLLLKVPSLKVLFQSGYTDDAVIRHGILQMEVSFIQKPYTPLVLARKVREVLDNKAAKT